MSTWFIHDKGSSGWVVIVVTKMDHVKDEVPTNAFTTNICYQQNNSKIKSIRRVSLVVSHLWDLGN